MHFETSIISAYLNDTPISKEPMYSYIKNYQKPDIKRKEIVEELSSQLCKITEGFPTFNPMIWNTLFSQQSDALDLICICPVVGSDTLCYKTIIRDQTYLFIDLIRVANHTQILSQMVYILNNLITFELSKSFILMDFPFDSKEYDSLLNEAAFVHGLAHWIAWNVSYERYVFHSDKYETHREKAFGLLSQSMNIKNKAMQHKILVHIHASDLWEQFPVVAGMFYFDDTIRDIGVIGLKQLYQLGPKNFTQRIFED